MTSPFRRYARHYDLLYRDKDYAAEAQFVARLLARNLGFPPRQTKILDLACGTGRHASELASLGYRVEGSDISADMIEIACERASESRAPLRFYNESFQTCDRIGEKYHAVIAMFAAIDYLTDYGDLARSLHNIRQLLHPSGVFIFDFWNGNAVLKSYAPERTKEAQDETLTVVRKSRTRLDRVAQVATVVFQFTLLESAAVVHEFTEEHRIRYFFPQEMTDLLAANGFEVVQRCPFLKDQRPIDPDEWNLTYVARPCV
jgi:2-polyprenyl-3-methyl-5-hydroxy-6-metoxy-1,4-benzoquinol methylase